MEYYFAPLEGITDVIYRNTFNKYYPGVNKFFAPFLSPSNDHILTNKEKYAIGKDSNNVNNLIPQILSKNATDTLWMIDELARLGYQEVNLNFGCPSGTVTAKGKGSKMLVDTKELDNYLSEVFSKSPLAISIKTRVGYESADNFIDVLNVYKKYPLKELIIHPRTRNEFYKGELHLDCIQKALDSVSFPIIYNGDIKTQEDIDKITKMFPKIKGIMIGRGLISTPYLLTKDKDINKLKAFYNELYLKQKERIGWHNTLYYLKEIWVLMQEAFIDENKLFKKLLKANDEQEFNEIVDKIFNNLTLK